jgi:hypothetical protein
MERRKYNILLVFALFFSFQLYGQTITVTGVPSFAASLFSVTEAGNNFTTTVSSATNATTINVASAATRYWHINVDRVDVNWNPNLHVWVKRTGAGTGTSGGTISGGTNFQDVTLTEALFFSGYKNRTGVTIQYQISGISMAVPAANYSTTIYFTIYRN